VRAPVDDWVPVVLDESDRFAAVAIGPGLGRDDEVARQVRATLDGLDRPVVLDSDGLWVLGTDVREVLSRRSAATVLTPHDGELERLTGAPPGDDRIGAARDLAAATRAVVLLKGATTVVAAPDGRALLVRAGDPRLATAGTGDVLTGVIAGLIASGADPWHGAAAGAHLHGRAALLGPARGLVAGDVVERLPAAWDHLLGVAPWRTGGIWDDGAGGVDGSAAPPRHP
jgi:NAD(P)H-hydrate epimerase